MNQAGDFGRPVAFLYVGRSENAGLPLGLRGRVITARVEGMAAREPPNGEPTASRGAVQAQTLGGVARTRGLETTHRSQQLRQGQLIDSNQKNQCLRDHPPSECAIEPSGWLASAPELRSPPLRRIVRLFGWGCGWRCSEQAAQPFFDLRAGRQPFDDHAVELGVARCAFDDHHEIDAARP